jgi:hypothetical protein
MAWICPVCDQVNDDDSLVHCTCGYDISDQELIDATQGRKTRAINSKKIYLGLYFIACYYVLEGSYTLYVIINKIVSAEINFNYILSALVCLGYIISSVGLLLKKGWGRNFAMFFTLFVFLPGFQEIARYIDKKDIVDLIKGSTSFLLAALIFIYLMKKNIKSIFTESPNSLFILGSFLFFYGLKHDSGIALVEYFWLTMSIVGFAMLLRAGQQRRKSLGIIVGVGSSLEL